MFTRYLKSWMTLSSKSLFFLSTVTEQKTQKKQKCIGEIIKNISRRHGTGLTDSVSKRVSNKSKGKVTLSASPLSIFPLPFLSFQRKRASKGCPIDYFCLFEAINGEIYGQVQSESSWGRHVTIKRDTDGWRRDWNTFKSILLKVLLLFDYESKFVKYFYCRRKF